MTDRQIEQVSKSGIVDRDVKPENAIQRGPGSARFSTSIEGAEEEPSIADARDVTRFADRRAHETSRGGSECRFACPLDPRPCDLAAVDLPCEVIEAGIGLRPCLWCERRVRADVERLHHVRLGRHERAVLTAASAPGSAFAAVRPEERDPSVRSALRRATARVRDAGLAETDLVGVDLPDRAAYEMVLHGGRMYRRPLRRITRRAYALAVRLTPLGAAVRAACAHELATGGRIRWSARVGALLEHLDVVPVPELLARWAAACRSEADSITDEDLRAGAVPGLHAAAMAHATRREHLRAIAAAAEGGAR